MATYPWEDGPTWAKAVEEFKEKNGREPNDIDKQALFLYLLAEVVFGLSKEASDGPPE